MTAESCLGERGGRTGRRSVVQPGSVDASPRRKKAHFAMFVPGFDSDLAPANTVCAPGAVHW